MTSRRRAAVVGAGTMGSGIAALLAQHGLAVTLGARREGSLERALAGIARVFDFLAGEGVVAPADAASARARIGGSTSPAEALADADLVIEAVPEDPDVKRETFRLIGAHAPGAALVASTTSGLNVFELAEPFPAPGRLLIAHFWNPAYLVPLVEVVPGPHTDPGTLEEMRALLEAWGRTPVTLSRYVPGFLGVRLNSALYREALDLIDQGITDARGIDAVMRESIALRLPVLDLFQIVDFGGLDTFALVWKHMFPLIAATPTVPAVVEHAVREGATGLKAGRGFHTYDAASREALLEARDRNLLRWLRERARYRLRGAADS